MDRAGGDGGGGSIPGVQALARTPIKIDPKRGIKNYGAAQGLPVALTRLYYFLGEQYLSQWYP